VNTIVTPATKRDLKLVAGVIEKDYI